MRYVVIILVVTMRLSNAENTGIPEKQFSYLKSARVSEDGAPGGSEKDAASFVDYLESDKQAVIDLLSEGIGNREQALVFACAEFMSPWSYVDFVARVSDLFEEGKVSQKSFEDLVSGLSIKDGFLYFNASHPDVKEILVQAKRALPPESSIVDNIARALNGDAAEEVRRRRSLAGYPPFEKLKTSQNAPKTPKNYSLTPGSEVSHSTNETGDDLSGNAQNITKEEGITSRLPWIIGGVLPLGIFILFLKILKGKSTS